MNKIINKAESILKKENIEQFITLSEEFGRFCASDKKISTSQIRGIFQVVKTLPDDYNEAKTNLHLLRPKLAYQKGRFKELTPLVKVLDALIKNIQNDDMLIAFKDFFEAILAYHRSYGGKE